MKTDIIRNDVVMWDDTLGRVLITYFENCGYEEAKKAGLISPKDAGCHVCFYNDSCCLVDWCGWHSLDLTTMVLDWYLEHLSEDKDWSVTITEVWHEPNSNKLTELIRKQTSYSDTSVREKVLPKHLEEHISNDMGEGEPVYNLPF